MKTILLSIITGILLLTDYSSDTNTNKPSVIIKIIEKDSVKNNISTINCKKDHKRYKGKKYKK